MAIELGKIFPAERWSAAADPLRRVAADDRRDTLLARYLPVLCTPADPSTSLRQRENQKVNDARTQRPTPPAVDLSLLLMRVIVGIIFMAHGAQKLFGAFGGQGMEAVVDNMGIIGYPVAVGEFFGGLGLVIGFLARFSAAANIVIMIGAIAMVHGKNGFFLSAGGYEYNLALIGLLAPILIIGPGRYAIGRLLPLPKSSGTDRPIMVLE